MSYACICTCLDILLQGIARQRTAGSVREWRFWVMEKRKRISRAAYFAGWILSLTVLLALVVGELGNLGSERARAADKRTVKVAFFPMEGYNEYDRDGSPAGMDVEYLENLCEYVNWEMEYVPCDSWDKALQMVLDREADLLGSVQYSAERAELYEYANLASGYTFGAIAVKGASKLAYEDFDAMSNVTYGVVKTYIRKDEFYDYLADHGIRRPKVKEYEDTAALQAALEEGEIDALVHSLTEIREGQRVIGRFAPMPFYYISWQGNDDLMRELNQGVADIKMHHPGLENELTVKYYDSRLDQTILLTNEEKQFISENENLKVGYFDDFYPFVYESEGECRGLARQMLEEVSVSTGFRFSYVKVESIAEAEKLLKKGEIDILSCFGEAAWTVKGDRLALTKKYAQAPYVIVMKKNSKKDSISTIAVEKGIASENKVMDFVDEGTEVITFDTQYDCLRNVKSGKADAAMCDGYLAEYLLGTDFHFNNMEIYSVLSDNHLLYMMVRDEGTPLLNILNKELLEVSDKMVNDYMLQDNFYSKMSIGNFVRENSIIIIAILCAAAILVILVLYRMLKNSRRIQVLMYKDTELDTWNLNYLKYRASLLLSADKNYAVAYTDISQFKRYNALYGWPAGKRILELFIEVASQELDREKELYARNYGSHFVLFVKCEDMEALEKRLRDFENKVSRRIYEEIQIHMAVVMGVCRIPKEGSDIELSLSYSIQAADSIKGSYSNGIQVYYEGLSSQLKEHDEREKLLESVDINKDFVAYYQAKVDIRNEQVIGAEALVRFKDPTDNGAIRAPGFFVPYYEQTGKITEIDFFVMEAVCKMLRRRIDAGKRVVPVSCNFSRLHFIKEDFAENFEAMINKYQVPKDLIEVEITETLVMEELEQQKIMETVDILKNNGVHLSIDDFGSGYSSLGVFEQIPASVIKLDRSFLLNNENRGRQVKIMRNIVNLAHDLDAQVVCEGVETDKDAELMMEIGAYVAQGYRYCKPIPEEEFEKMLERG